MIKFFRKFRKNSISQGKAGNYLKYSIGEITLVVIGILIALQINNWNQDSQLKKEELKTLNSLYQAIQINKNELDKSLMAQITRNESLQEILRIDVDTKKLVYLDSIISINIKNHTFDPSTGVYNSMINSGKIELISNDTIKNRISKLYDRVKDYQESEREVTEYTKEHLEPSFIENSSINPMVLARQTERTETEKSIDREYYNRNFSSQKIKNMYILLLNKMSVVIQKGQDLNTEYQLLLSNLESEIQERN